MIASAKARAWFRRAVVGIALWLPVEVMHWIRHVGTAHHQHVDGQHVDWFIWLSLVTSTIGLAYVGWAFYRSAIRALLRGTSNMDTLIAMGATVAYIYSLAALLGNLSRGWPLADLYFMESTGLLALISLGHWLEARARDSAGSAIRELLNLAPATAIRICGVGASPTQSGLEPEDRGRGAHATEEVSVSELAISDLILIRPGDRVPIDGVVIDGRSSVDESMITGEPLPVTRETGDPVIGGTQNVDGALRVRVTKTGGETALSQIVQLVEHAQSSKPEVQKLADRDRCGVRAERSGDRVDHRHRLVPLRHAPRLGRAAHLGHARQGGVQRPHHRLSVRAGTCRPSDADGRHRNGRERGILIRDIDALQTAEKIDTVVLDKTGTITQGKPVVCRIRTRRRTG